MDSVSLETAKSISFLLYFYMILDYSIFLKFFSLNLILILALISSSYYLFEIFLFIFARNYCISEAWEVVQVQTIQKHQFTQTQTFSQGLRKFATLNSIFSRVAKFRNPHKYFRKQPSQIFSQGLRNFATQFPGACELVLVFKSIPYLAF